MDQTPFNYEIVGKRTMATKVQRDVIVSVNQPNKASHSYTSQPMISRDGQLIGKISLILQESTASGNLGPRIGRDMRRQEADYGSIKVFASRSGEVTKNIIRDWIRDVVHPALNLTLTAEDTDTDTNVSSQESGPSWTEKREPDRR